MKILITGAAGFIGSQLSEYLAKKRHDVIGIDNLSDYYDVKLKHDNVNCIKNAGVHFLKADLLNLDEYRNVGNGFDFIFHLAAQTGLSKSNNFESYLNNNVIATKNLIEFSKSQKRLRHFFNISTSSVYGKYATVSEKFAPQPISNYGITKLTAEQMVLSESRMQHFRASSFRLYSVYGPRERPDKLFTKLIHCAMNDLKFPLYEGSLTHERSYTYVGDVVSALANSLKIHNILDGEIINLGHFQKNSTQDGILIVEKLLKKHIQLEVLPPRDGDQQQTEAIMDKAKILLNFRPRTSFEGGIKQQIEWYKSKLKTTI